MKITCLKPSTKKVSPYGQYNIFTYSMPKPFFFLYLASWNLFSIKKKVWFKLKTKLLSMCLFLSFSSHLIPPSTGNRDPGLECSQPSQRCLRTVGQWGQEPVQSWLWGNGEQTSSLTLTLSHSLTHTESHKRSAVRWLLCLTAGLRFFLLLPGLCESHAASMSKAPL